MSQDTTAHRPAFRQERPYARAVALALGLVCAVGRHTITQLLVALGLGQVDWSGFYRLYSRPRLDYDRLTRCLLGQTLGETPVAAVYPVVLDGTQVPRSSQRLPGTSWLKAPRTPPWRPGIHRAQRFVGVSWLTPRSVAGDSRALPLRLVPAFPPKAVPAAGVAPVTEWAAGRAALVWLRAELDAAGRATQRVLAMADGVYDTKGLWATLPAGVSLLARTARNRALFALPGDTPRRGRPRKYGPRVPTPAAWLALRRGWRRVPVAVRGRTIPLTYRVEGPVLVPGVPAQPLFLLVVKGIDQHRRRRQRAPTFWLVSAVADAAGGWGLPRPAADLLAWAWQRWEVEVMHRELKSGFGLGEQQAWGPVSAILTVQWVAWVYALIVLTGYRAWGLEPGPVPPLGRWWGGRRWSLGRLWQGMRAELWDAADFRPIWTRTASDWWEMADWTAAQTNAALGVRRL
jgi:hypothetical protein